MLKCQRNDESSFAVSASMCIRRKVGEGGRLVAASKGYKGESTGRRGMGDKGSRARRRT